MPTIYVLDVPEFRSIVDGARSNGFEVCGPTRGYYRITRAGELVMSRKALGLKPAVWYGALTGGLDGRIVQFDRDTLRVVDQ